VPDHRHAALVVDDHDDFREVIEILVSSTRLDVATAHTAAEALAHLRREPHRWCLVLMDWWLPDMTGEEFRRQQCAEPRIAGICVAVVPRPMHAREARHVASASSTSS
jgi:CheY-like chemotaxis protein